MFIAFRTRPLLTLVNYSWRTPGTFASGATFLLCCPFLISKFNGIQDIEAEISRGVWKGLLWCERWTGDRRV